jgi:hypothetical protein
VENFPVVQPAILASIVCVGKSALLRAFLQHFRVKPRMRMTALQQAPRICPHENQRRLPKIKDPSGGTTGRVKAIWALGVDGRSRRIQPMGRDNRSHAKLVASDHRTFNAAADFFNSF